MDVHSSPADSASGDAGEEAETFGSRWRRQKRPEQCEVAAAEQQSWKVPLGARSGGQTDAGKGVRRAFGPNAVDVRRELAEVNKPKRASGRLEV